MADVFLNVKRIRRVWFPEGINGLYPLGKAEIGEDIYALNESIRNGEGSANDAAVQNNSASGVRRNGAADALPMKLPRGKKDRRAEEEIKSLKRRLDGMKSSIDARKSTLTRIRQDIKRKRESIGRTEYEIEAAEFDQKQLEDNFQSLKEDYTQSIKSSKHNREGEEKAICEVREQLREDTKLPPEVFGSHDEIERIKREIEKRDENCRELRANLTSVTCQRKMMQGVLTKQNVAPSTSQAAALIHRLVDYAHTSAKQFETFKLKLKDTFDKKKKSQQELDRKNREIQSLTEDMARQEQLNTELQEADKTLAGKSDAEKDVAKSLEQEANLLYSEEIDREKEIRMLRQQYDALRDVLTTTESRAIAAEEAYKKHLTELQVFKLGKRALDITVDKLSKKRKVLLQEYDDLTAKIEKHEKGEGTEFKDKDKLEEMITEVRNMYSKKQELEKEVTLKEGALKDKEGTLKSLKSTLEQTLSHIKEQEKEFSEQTNVSTKLTEQLGESGKKK
mmetsp:Transcript_1305/g.3046  ORF Transcript_1305/g.3046 Transcript_1305/m.3046 type:complete len:507 (-) Transcript_1305:249-1769(-)|eukprot:CAMPEP_0114509618 /NCGR_PEP_ID=MMETSP0109-20121206/13310_1 /TAXON_ID=29199 /ORGANISM="Chlorarachnion reptans, Strain CCCM449" /LENGTH=506 /DNA_ID=CAMNT_0001688791 /DNA_START=44 /DNA_END=1564 /DNA_ORIENTATION=+